MPSTLLSLSAPSFGQHPTTAPFGSGPQDLPPPFPPCHQVTITTNPSDLASSGRALINCTAPRDTPCIRAGEGLYGGAAALSLYGFDVVMGGGATGTCVQLNEGAGSGTSAYWAFYLAATGRQPTTTVLAVRRWEGARWEGMTRDAKE